MSITFILTGRANVFSSNTINTAYLSTNNWDDFHFKTSFSLTIFDELGNRHEIGALKLGCTGLSSGWAKDEVEKEFPASFQQLSDTFFSLGQDSSYYSNLYSLPEKLRINVLSGLKDIAYDREAFEVAKGEDVFKTSLLRYVSLASIKGQYHRILKGEAPLTNFEFTYRRLASEKSANVELDFDVKTDSKPSTNIHVLIGRNGVGKTTILNNIVKSVINNEASEDVGSLIEKDDFLGETIITKNFFSSISSVSFSAFDPFTPPADRIDRSLGTCYYYIGLKNNTGSENPELKNTLDLRREFVESLLSCFSQKTKKNRWHKAIKTLESDDNFSEMNLEELVLSEESKVKDLAKQRIKKMSSGHSIVLLTLTKLIETVEEKTLVLVDEPESHLHPPLLSAFIRALSDLLLDRNAVAIIATHSPVVLQEVPKSCVWKLSRSRLVGKSYRPQSETFGENAGVLTREVFGLEVEKSGFHKLLKKSVDEGKSYEKILEDYKEQIGYEGKAILRALIYERDSKEEE